MRLLPTSDQITDDLNDLKLRIAKMNARRNAQLNLLQRKVMGGSLRSKYYPWSRDYYRRLYNTYPRLYPFSAYPWSSSLDSLELDKYYDSLNLDNKLYAYDLDDPLYSKYKRIGRTTPTTDLLSKLKDFVFEQERQMTTDLLRKISEDKLRSDRPSVYGRESKSPSRYDVALKNEPPFLNPINKKDNFYKRYNSFIKKILRPLRKTSPVKYETPIPKAPSLSPKTNYLSRSYLDDYYYPSQFYNPYWYRYSSYPYNRRYLYDYDLPKVQPASVPLDVESIIRKSNIDDRNYKLKKNYVPTTYKYDPFESDSYLRSSLPTWKQYYYTQKLRSKPSNECFLDYYDPYYDFFPDAASVDSTDELSNALPSDDPNQLVDEYRDAIYEDIIHHLRDKQSKRMPLRADRKLFGYRVRDRPASYFNSQPYSTYRPTYAPRAAHNYSQTFPTYYPKDPSEPTYCKPNEQTDTKDHLNTESHLPNTDTERNNSQDYQTKPDEPSQTRQNVVSPSIFHRKCTTPVDNSFKYSENLSPSKSRTWNDGKQSPRNTDASADKKLERYRSSNTLNKLKTSYDENKRKYDTERIADHKPNSLYDEYMADNSSQYKPDTSKSQYNPSVSQHKPDVGQYSDDTATSQYKPSLRQYKPDVGGQYSEDNATNQYKPSLSQYKPDVGGQYSDDIATSQYKPSLSQYKPDIENQYSDDTATNQYKPSLSQYKPDIEGQYSDNTSTNQYKHSFSQYKPDVAGQYSNDTSMNQYKPSLSQYKPDIGGQYGDDTSTNQYKPSSSQHKADGDQYRDDTYGGQYKVGQYKPDSSIGYKDTSANDKADTSPTRFGFTRPENPNEYQSFSTVASDKFVPISSPTKRPLVESSRSNANESSSDTFAPINPPKPRSQLRRPSNYPSESEFIKTLTAVEADKLQRKNSLDKRRESLTNETLPERFRLPSGGGEADFGSDAAQRQTSPTAKKAGWQDNREDSENRRSARSRQPTPTERTLSRRNSAVFDPSKLSTNSTSRRNSIKPLQRRNSIQPVAEKRNVLKMSNEKYEDEQSVSNENSPEFEHVEVPFRSLTQFQKKLSKDEVLSDEVARKNVDSVKNSNDLPANQYDFKAEESVLHKTPAPETNYYDNTSSYEENSKDSYGRDGFNEKEQFYPQYNYDTKYDSTIPQGSSSEQTYPADVNSLDNQKSNTQVESGNDYSGYYASNVSDENAKSLERSAHVDSSGDQEPVSQSSDSRSRRSFQQSDENADASLSFHESPVRSYEPKEELSLNAINEEAEKAESKETDKNVQPTASAATTSTIPKRSVDYGRSTLRELSRRPSRSALLSQSSDDKKLKSQSSGELQKRTSKPKIGESKLRRTTSTFKVRPTGPVKKT